MPSQTQQRGKQPELYTQHYASSNPYQNPQSTSQVADFQVSEIGWFYLEDKRYVVKQVGATLQWHVICCFSIYPLDKSNAERIASMYIIAILHRWEEQHSHRLEVWCNSCDRHEDYSCSGSHCVNCTTGGSYFPGRSHCYVHTKRCHGLSSMSCVFSCSVFFWHFWIQGYGLGHGISLFKYDANHMHRDCDLCSCLGLKGRKDGGLMPQFLYRDSAQTVDIAVMSYINAITYCMVQFVFLVCVVHDFHYTTYYRWSERDK